VPTHPSAPRPGPTLITAAPAPNEPLLTLQRFARLLAEGHGGDRPVLFGLAREGEAVDLSMRPLDTADLVDELAGWRAPPEWFAVGLAAPATVTRQRERTRADAATVAVLAGRDGTVAVAVAGEENRPSWTAGGAGVVGRAADLCLRALAAPTPACPEPPRAAWVIAWLDTLVERAAGRPHSAAPWTWADVAAAHPLAGVLAPTATPAALRVLGAHPLARGPWESLRVAAVALRRPAFRVAPEVAAWLDGGSFGRHVLASYPPPSDLAAALLDLLPGAVRRDVWRVAAAWGLHLAPSRSEESVATVSPCPTRPGPPPNASPP
jgi:hypothetical protein